MPWPVRLAAAAAVLGLGLSLGLYCFQLGRSMRVDEAATLHGELRVEIARLLREREDPARCPGEKR